MSIDNCQYCNEYYDQDFNVEHEEECESNPKNMEKTTLERLEDLQNAWKKLKKEVIKEIKKFYNKINL